MSDCQEHDGSRTAAGYGRVFMDGKQFYAHRLAWALHNGADPAGKVVRHTCDNPPCVNPEHLVIGTQRDNVDDKVARGRQQRGEVAPGAVLTESAIQYIKLNPEKLFWRELAAKFGCAKATIGDVVRGRTWTHVT